MYRFVKNLAMDLANESPGFLAFSHRRLRVVVADRCEMREASPEKEGSAGNMESMFFTGADATALRRAMRCGVGEFAKMLGVSVATVYTWSSPSRGVDPGPSSQDALAGLLRLQNPAIREAFFTLGGPVPGVTSLADLGADADVSAETAVSLADRMSGLVGDSAVADRLEIEIARLAVAYVHEPLPKVYRELLDVHRELDRALTVPRRPHEQAHLIWLSSAAGLLLAHGTQNLGRPRAALKHVFAARSLADVVDSDALRAAAHATTALLLEWSRTPEKAVVEVRKGLAFATGAQTRRRLLAVGARAAARAGDAETAKSMLRLMESAREPGPPTVDGVADLGGLLAFPRAKREYYIGGTELLLGRYEPAAHHCEFAIDAYQRGPDHDRSYGDLALALLSRAEARLQLGDSAGAAEDVAAALAQPDGKPLPEGHRISQLSRALTDLHRRALELQYHGVPEAEAVAGQITLHLPPAQRRLPSSGA
ncbi:hypothetical protein [Amycolatopsis sp. NPDC004079]|uniref:hypothetical protein n=1 Tax=Amycolatopsis sp. NPDC004079 TaxID=3154549 RepID=UPI0033BDEA09